MTFVAEIILITVTNTTFIITMIITLFRTNNTISHTFEITLFWFTYGNAHAKVIRLGFVRAFAGFVRAFAGFVRAFAVRAFAGKVNRP